MSNAPIIPEDVLRSIREGAAGVRSAGEALTIRIKAFEAWLGKLRGRVETSCSIGGDADGEEITYLSFAKDGKEWALYLYEYNEGRECSSESRLLRDASINDKAWAIDHFQDLLKAMVISQAQMVGRAASAINSYDTFAKTIGLKEGA